MLTFNFPLKLGKIWFLIWLTGIGLYLFSRSVKRYIEIKNLNLENIYDRTFDYGVMNMYLMSIIAAITLYFLCCFLTVVNTGNYANDGLQFGKEKLDFRIMKIQLQREDLRTEMVPGNDQFSSCFSKRLKYHCPPFFLLLYFGMSYSLIAVLPFIEAERIRHDLDKPNSVWHTNLDIAFNPDYDQKSMIYGDTFFRPISAEFFNLCISLILPSYTYSNVFWKFSKFYSFLFSTVIFITGFIFILDFALIEMLIKLSNNPQILAPPLRLEFLWTPSLTIQSLLAAFFSILLQISLFEYGYIRLSESLFPRQITEMNDTVGTYNTSSNISLKMAYVCRQLCYDIWSGALIPFVCGIFCTFFNICCRLSYIYRAMSLIYTETKNSLILANLIASVLFLLLMVVLWICLLLRSYWPTQQEGPQIPSNSNCVMYVSNHYSNVPAMPVYATVNRHPSSSPPVGQEPNFPIFCDPGALQWRYSCSPPSCAPNDSNSDKTGSFKNQENGTMPKNNIYVKRVYPYLPNVDSPKIGNGIYSQLIKLAAPVTISDDNGGNGMTSNTIPNDLSDTSSNQTVHIIGSVSRDMNRSITDRLSSRRRPSTSEYFNITTNGIQIEPLVNTTVSFETAHSTNTDAESMNLCSQV